MTGNHGIRILLTASWWLLAAVPLFALCFPSYRDLLPIGIMVHLLVTPLLVLFGADSASAAIAQAVGALLLLVLCALFAEYAGPQWAFAGLVGGVAFLCNVLCPRHNQLLLLSAQMLSIALLTLFRPEIRVGLHAQLICVVLPLLGNALGYRFLLSTRAPARRRFGV